MGKTGCKPVSPEIRFWRYVDKSEACWLWTASLNHSGYGVFGSGVGHRAKVEGAHRFSWKLHHGPIPDGLYVCHRCDNPRCVRPDHLFLGDQFDNMRDMRIKGRKKTKLSSADVKYIKESDLTQVQLAEMFGVTQANISCVLLGLTWKHIEVFDGR